MPAIADWIIAICAVVANVLTIVILTQKQNKKIDDKFEIVRLNFDEVKIKLTELTVGTVARLQGDVERLASDLELAKMGNDKWVEELRSRTHKLVEDYQNVILKIDRLERK